MVWRSTRFLFLTWSYLEYRCMVGSGNDEPSFLLQIVLCHQLLCRVRPKTRTVL